MPTLFRDYETRSTLALRDVGTYRYAADPATNVWCCAYAVDVGPVELWVPGDPVPAAFVEAAKDADWLVVAHNDTFERLIEQNIMAPRYGWSIIPIERHRCTMAGALALALPAALKDVAELLGLKHRKADGSRMVAMSRPRNPRKGEDPAGTYWHDDQEHREALYAYCRQDMEVVRELDRRLPPLIPSEQALWELDAAINDRGFYIDGALIEAAAGIVAAAGEEVQNELRELTGGAIGSVNQVAALLAWLAERGCAVTDLRKPTLRQALTRTGLAPELRRVIELRLQAAHPAAAKINALAAWRNIDGRVRGTLQYHGAATGRWAGRGPQPQNFRREADNTEAKIAAVMSGDIGRVRALGPPLEVVGEISRALICAASGHRFLVADFSGIESRVLAWIAGERTKLDAWIRFDSTGAPVDDPYYMLGKRCGLPDDIARNKGKICDLAFGYQGGKGAWTNLAPEGDASTAEDVERYKRTWRNAHPKTVKFWGDIDSEAVRAVRRPGLVLRLGRLSLVYNEPFLSIELPSSRSITYPFPRVELGQYGDFMVVFKDNAGGKFVDCKHGHGFYGGAWAENIVSGIARDLLAAAMARLEGAGYPVVLHVHDEIICEVPEGFGSLNEFKRLVVAAPDWADGLPIAAKVRSGPRFSKLSSPEAADRHEESSNQGIGGFVENGKRVRQAKEREGGDVPEGDFDDRWRDAPDGAHASTWETPSFVELAHVRPWNIDPIEYPPLREELEGTSSNTGTNETKPNGAGANSSGRAGQGNGGPNRHGWAYSDGSSPGEYAKAEVEQDEYVKHNDGKPFDDGFLQRKGYQLAHRFEYRLPDDGTLLYEMVRYHHRTLTDARGKPLKKCLPRVLVTGRWVFGAGNRRVVYGWPAIMKAGPGATVFVTEGELNADRLIKAGLLATTVLSHGWAAECVTALAGRHIIILADHDPGGATIAADARQKLSPAAASIRVVSAKHLWKRLPGPAREPRQGDDVVDWIDREGGDPAKLLEICREVPAEGAALRPINIAAWDDKPVPEQEWAVHERFPLRQVALLSGEGGEGKSLLLLHLCHAHVLGRDWLGMNPRPGPAIFIDCEDDEKVLHQRSHAIARYYGEAKFSELARRGLNLISLVGEDAVLCAAAGRSGLLEPTMLYHRLLEMAGDIKPAMIGIASSADVFAGNEIDRGQVRQFIRMLTKVAIVANGGLTLVSHPSLTGIATGTGLSGSTHWHNGVRARCVVKTVKPKSEEAPPADGLRAIEFHKVQYGPPAATVFVRWKDGMFLPAEGVASMDAAGRANKADELYVTLLQRLTAQNQVLRPAPGRGYGCMAFALHPDAAGISSKEFAQAQQRLLDAGVIEIAEEGPPSKRPPGPSPPRAWPGPSPP
jgi:DNA polymerase